MRKVAALVVLIAAARAVLARETAAPVAYVVMDAESGTILGWTTAALYQRPCATIAEWSACGCCERLGGSSARGGGARRA